MASLRIGFAGCHEISWHCLRAIADLCKENGDALAGVFNLQPEAGAKHSAFVEFTSLEAEFGFPYHKVQNLTSPDTLALLCQLKLDVFFIIGWHRIVPQEVIDVAPLCFGMHSSMLPKNRGSSPINWAIIRGDTMGGMSLFHLTTGVDSGDVVSQKTFPILEDDTCHDLHGRATVAAVELLRENWAGLRSGTLPRFPQDESVATVNDRRRPEDGAIDWGMDAKRVHAWVRALTHPYPGAFATFRGKKLFIWEARIAKLEPPIQAAPGSILVSNEGIVIATRTGAVEARTLQFAGEPQCDARLFRSTYKLEASDIFA